jgi:hypothetical protein
MWNRPSWYSFFPLLLFCSRPLCREVVRFCFCFSGHGKPVLSFMYKHVARKWFMLAGRCRVDDLHSPFTCRLQTGYSATEQSREAHTLPTEGWFVCMFCFSIEGASRHVSFRHGADFAALGRTGWAVTEGPMVGTFLDAHTGLHRDAHTCSNLSVGLLCRQFAMRENIPPHPIPLFSVYLRNPDPKTLHTIQSSLRTLLL